MLDHLVASGPLYSCGGGFEQFRRVNDLDGGVILRRQNAERRTAQIKQPHEMRVGQPRDASFLGHFESAQCVAATCCELLRTVTAFAGMNSDSSPSKL